MTTTATDPTARTATVPTRTFLPLALSPLMSGSGRDADTDLAVRLATTAEPTPALVRSLLAITESGASERVTTALDQREDLPPTSLTLLLAHRPHLKASAARLRTALFPSNDPAACHSFARTVAALAHLPEHIDLAYLAGGKFAAAAAAADPQVLKAVLAGLLTAPALAGPADAALGRLLEARTTAGTPEAAVDRDAAAARERTRRTRIGTELAARRTETIQAIAAHTAGRTLAATLWTDALTTAADTPQSAGQALAMALLAPQLLTADGPPAGPATPWPAVTARWQQVLAAARTARTARTEDDRWHRAWENAATTPDGSTWDPAQRGLVAGYDLLTEHVHTLDTTTTVPTPQECWATDPVGRALLHTVADHLTGHQGASALTHFDDALLISFLRALAKNRRDKIPGGLQIHGMIAALKAARSRHHLLTLAATPDLGIVVPMRAEAHRLTGAPAGRDPLTAKTAQLAWLLSARPEARAHLLLVDEDSDGASAHAAQQITATHPQIEVTVATRPDTASAKAGAVLWGLAQLRAAGHTTLVYTDLDLTYPLDQLGLHLAALAHPGTGAVIGSRRQPDSHGYYPPSGPTDATRLYQQAVAELLQLTVGDPQAGFKAFTAAALAAAEHQVADRGMSFDTELLTLIQRAGHTVTEVGIAALHRWTDGQQGAPRDYDRMLTAVYEQARRHGPDPDARPTPVLDRIHAAGSLAQAAARPAPTAVAIVPAPR
ncbi:glycosyltransferase family protein [Streptomyces goshikiensis]|uniref:hypothetical protein n=1 Tax=Streptomyces goshikiensis TaxID=1942 RepID=UPI0036BA9D48